MRTMGPGPRGSIPRLLLVSVLSVLVASSSGSPIDSSLRGFAHANGLAEFHSHPRDGLSSSNAHLAGSLASTFYSVSSHFHDPAAAEDRVQEPRDQGIHRHVQHNNKQNADEFLELSASGHQSVYPYQLLEAREHRLRGEANRDIEPTTLEFEDSPAQAETLVQPDDAPRFRSQAYVSLASNARGIVSCPTITDAPVPTGVQTPTVRSQDASGNWKYENANYTYSVEAMQRREVCNVVSSNGYFHLAVVKLRVSATAEAACLATVSIGGDVAQALCFREGLADVPSDGCTGASLSVGVTTGTSYGLVLTFGRFVRGLVGNYDKYTFQTGSFWIDIDGKMKIKDSSSAQPTDLFLMLHDGLPFHGCFFSAKKYAVYGGILQFKAPQLCSKSCTSTPISFFFPDTTAEYARFDYDYQTSKTDIQQKTISIENGWSVSQSQSLTVASKYEAGTVYTPMLAPQSPVTVSFSWEVTVGFTSTNGGATIEEKDVVQETTSKQMASLQYVVPPGQVLTLFDSTCTTTCVLRSDPGIAVKITDAYGTNTTFVTSSSYISQSTSTSKGLTVDLAVQKDGDFATYVPPLKKFE